MDTHASQDDDAIANRLLLSTQPLQYTMGMPGPGDRCPFVEDIHIRLSGWAANYAENMCETDTMWKRQLTLVPGTRREFVSARNVDDVMVRVDYGTDASVWTDDVRFTEPAYMLRSRVNTPADAWQRCTSSVLPPHPIADRTYVDPRQQMKDAASSSSSSSSFSSFSSFSF